jgi:phage terminase small subunit
MEENKELTVKQRKFIEEYVVSGNATQAYFKAGYKASSNSIASSEGFKLLKKPSIKKAIEEKMKELQSEKIASQTEILELLTKGVRGELTEEVFLMNGTKETKQISGKERVKCMELLGKKYGIFTDKVEHSGEIGVQIVDDLID